MLKARYELAADRVRQMAQEQELDGPAADYFRMTAEFAALLTVEYEFVKSGALREASLTKLQEHNRALYEDILPHHYETSYGNPAYAVQKLGLAYGRLLCFVYTELRSAIQDVYEQYLEGLVIRMELLIEIYTAFVCAKQEQNGLPEYEEIRQTVYWFVSDYAETQMERRSEEQLNPDCDFATRMVMDCNLCDPRYLYYYGEYITDNETGTAGHLARLDEEELALMADTYTQGYRLGFEVGNKDLSKKKTVNIRYHIGFERMIRRAVANFREMGLRPTIYRASASTFHRRGMNRVGYCSTPANKQFEFDHKEDEGLYLDGRLVNRRLEILHAAFEKNRELASLHGGPAVVETFGETPFAPLNRPEAVSLSGDQQKLAAQYAAASGEITNRYIRGEERSFTIIAFPLPEIGAQYPQIFNEIVKINTLDYRLYRDIQQTIIDTLNRAAYVTVTGTNGNRTDIRVALHELSDPARETLFENCVADVNIPVGEVFTSPTLAGTTGLLHVASVFLNGLEFQNLELTFRDGMVTDYSCTNFENRQDNRKYVKDNVLFHHDSLPLGEFAIGTNTTAYVTAQKYGIGDRLPILIAEKMGPHFAVGDTCYSYAEDVAVYNPDGKEIVARDNEVSLLRAEDPAKAYFNCHTDITIPYDELGELAAVTAAGESTAIIREGRFVLPGCEQLNRPFL